MKIAILTSGILPVPAVQGGAVENLIDFYLEYNDLHHLHDITVYSVWHPDVEHHPARQSKVNHYRYIKENGLISKIKKNIYDCLHKNEYYHHSIEYFFEQAYKDMCQEKYDIIIVENRPGYAIKLRERIAIPCVLHLHNDFLNKATPKAETIFEGYEKIVCVSDFIKRQIEQIDENNAKCVTVYNAIDLQFFDKAQPKQRTDLGLTKEDFVLVYSGRLRQEKGIMPLIQAMSHLQDVPNLKLLIIGASNYGKGQPPSPFVMQLMEAAESIKDRVIFTGFIDYGDVPAYLKMADIAVVPSIWDEPFGLTVVEAMAAGLPLITTRSGGIPEICEGVATIVDRENIIEHLASAIIDLYEHPEKRKQMAAASLERSKLFDKETYAKNFFAALENIG